MKRYKLIIIVMNLIFLLGFFNYSVIQKEALLSDSQLILLELVPVDPRSLIQGDYMILSYKIGEHDNTDNISKRGFCVVKLGQDNIAQKVRLQPKKTPLDDGELLIEYTSKTWRGINIGAESYFFQEGHANKYEAAKYGGIKVDDKGNSLLIGLYDEHKRKIE